MSDKNCYMKVGMTDGRLQLKSERQDPHAYSVFIMVLSLRPQREPNDETDETHAKLEQIHKAL